MRLHSSFLLALLLAVPLAHARPAASHATATTDARPTVLLVGDSLSAAHRILPETGWVVLLQHRLDAATPHPPFIVNASHGGKTLTDALKEMPALLAKHHPATVILELGANDAFFGADQNELEQSLTQLIEMAKASGAKVALLGFELPPVLDKHHNASALRNAYADVQKQQKIVFLPSLMAGISNKPALLLDDGVHPTAAAQVLMLDNAWDTLRPLLVN